MSESKRTIPVIPGQIWLYRHTQTKNWMCRIKRPNHQPGGDYFRKTTGKADLDEAKQEALRLYHIVHSGVEGVEVQLKPGSKRVKHVIQDLIRRSDENRFKLTKNDRSILTTYITEQLGEIPIKRLKFAHYDDYLRNPKLTTASTVANHISALNKLTRFCVLKDYILAPEAFSITSREYTKDKDSREVAKFTDEDWEAMLNRFDAFINQEGLKAVTRQRRKLLRIYMQFLMESGVRPGAESDGICVNDITMIKRDGRLACSIHIRSGKVSAKHKREIPLNYEATKALIEAVIFQLGKDGLTEQTVHKIEKEQTGDFNPFPDNPTLQRLKRARKGDWPEYFSLLKELGFGGVYPFRLNGKRIDWSQVFTQFRDFMGDTLNPNKYYKLYSCRHRYITRELINGRDIYRLAKYCGTSVQMIEQFYSKMMAMSEAAEMYRNNPEVNDTEDKRFTIDPSLYIKDAKERAEKYDPAED